MLNLCLSPSITFSLHSPLSHLYTLLLSLAFLSLRVSLSFSLSIYIFIYPAIFPSWCCNFLSSYPDSFSLAHSRFLFLNFLGLPHVIYPSESVPLSLILTHRLSPLCSPSSRSFADKALTLSITLERNRQWKGEQKNRCYERKTVISRRTVSFAEFYRSICHIMVSLRCCYNVPWQT